MKELTVLKFGQSERLDKMLEFSISEYDYHIITKVDDMNDLQNKRILFAIELGNAGINIEHMTMLTKIRLSGSDFMHKSIGGIIISSDNELFSRSVARQTIFYANMAGCMFPGKPLSEATGSLRNFSTQQIITEGSASLEDILMLDCKNVVDRIMKKKDSNISNPKILALYSGNYKSSNTYALWNMVKENLQDCQINEIHIENGSVVDCKGCSYKACKHYSKSTNCFYGGIMVEEIYPAIIDCDVLMMLCPNYNDSITANMSAVINRLTALYRKTKFYDKYFYSIIVSGFSGSDIVAQQLICALNINKTFMLPPQFAFMETANNPGDVEKIEGIREKAKEFAMRISYSNRSYE
ncbi:MAG: NAD(P)H-dependent oxidoreductase [Tissierellia bacterium]|nr:NAD(P)H-dependent oxidoreductase [Tissierellia bacterium]